MKNHIIDHLVMIALTFFGAYLLFIDVLPVLLIVFIFYSPLYYLIVRKPSILTSIILPAIAFGFFFGFIFEYINVTNNSWAYPRGNEFLPFKLFDAVYIEVQIWYILWVSFIVGYYEYFFDSQNKVFLRNALRKLALPMIFAFVLFIIFKVTPLDFRFDYTYTLTASLALVPLVLLAWKRPGVFKKVLCTIPFFIFFFGVMEFVALSTDTWVFTGNYLYALNFAGHTLPLEELIAWIIMSSAVISAYHEIWTDDLR